MEIRLSQYIRIFYSYCFNSSARHVPYWDTYKRCTALLWKQHDTKIERFYKQSVWTVLLVVQALIKQDNLDAFNEKDPYKADDSREDEDDSDDNDNSLEAETFPLERDEVMPPPIPLPPSERVSFPKGLPWAPKVRYPSVWLKNNPAFLITFELCFFFLFLSSWKKSRKNLWGLSDSTLFGFLTWSSFLPQGKGHWKFPGI